MKDVIGMKPSHLKLILLTLAILLGIGLCLTAGCTSSPTEGPVTTTTPTAAPVDETTVPTAEAGFLSRRCGYLLPQSPTKA